MVGVVASHQSALFVVVLRLRVVPEALDVAPLSAPPPVVNRAKTCACVGRDVL